MIDEYLTLADRIRQDLNDLTRIVKRAERAVKAARQRPADQDLYLDSAVLNLVEKQKSRSTGLKRFSREVCCARRPISG